MMRIWIGLFCGALLLGSPAAATELAARGTQFTIDGKPVFLLGCSYYAGLGASEQAARSDLDGLRKLGFNWVRVWATWAAFDHDVSAVDAEGRARGEYLDRLKWLVAECDKRGMIVDVTLSRGNGGTGPVRLQGLANHQRAVETILSPLKQYTNWYIDLANERNVEDKRFVSIEDLAQLRALVRKLDGKRLVTASHAGDLSKTELERYLRTVEVDFVSLHRPRSRSSPAQTEASTREILSWMKDLGRVVPLHYDEPFRRGYGTWEPTADDFRADLLGARQGGAAGWCFHNGSQRTTADARPRRSFDLSDMSLFDQLDQQERSFFDSLAQSATHDKSPRIGFRGLQG